MKDKNVGGGGNKKFHFTTIFITTHLLMNINKNVTNPNTIPMKNKLLSLCLLALLFLPFQSNCQEVNETIGTEASIRTPENTSQIDEGEDLFPLTRSQNKQIRKLLYKMDRCQRSIDKIHFRATLQDLRLAHIYYRDFEDGYDIWTLKSMSLTDEKSNKKIEKLMVKKKKFMTEINKITGHEVLEVLYD